MFSNEVVTYRPDNRNYFWTTQGWRTEHQIHAIVVPVTNAIHHRIMFRIALWVTVRDFIIHTQVPVDNDVMTVRMKRVVIDRNRRTINHIIPQTDKSENNTPREHLMLVVAITNVHNDNLEISHRITDNKLIRRREQIAVNNQPTDRVG